jgi:hypothetical protein
MSRLVGAGVLCYGRGGDGHIALLLGREREVLGWKQGSRKWSAFSGRAEEGELAQSVAAREFVEETCGTVPLRGCTDVEGVRRFLEQAPSVELTLQTTAAENEEGPLLSHVTYLCEVPREQGLEERFTRTRTELTRLESVFRAFYRLRKNSEFLSRLFLPGFVLGAGVVTTDFLPEAPDLVRLVCLDAAREASVLVLRVSPEAFEEAVALHAAWALLKAFVAEHAGAPIFSHPAVRLVHHAGELVAAYVNKAFLEKTEIAWWDLSELEALARERWRGGDSFRRYFLDNLRHLAPKIRALTRGEEEEEGGQPPPPPQGQS